ncbi:MAG: protein kinase [Verrucomicrobiota bacterium]
MNDPKKCETCGAPLQSVDELCSNCLIRAGIDETVVLSDEMILTKDADQNVAHVGEGAWDYEILEEIAQGGMGVVYKARQKKLNRVVALKMLFAGAFARQDVLKRFLSEAEVVAHLDHPNIVPIYEIGRHDGQTFFTMKYIENGTLKESLPSLMAHPRRAVELMVKVVKAVHFAHQRGVLHRDIKPGNILIDAKGEPWVTDFGLAKREGEDVTMTRTGTIMGTPAYMAPEQAKSGRIPLTTSADVYSLGAVLYHLFTGRPPFDAEDPLELLQYVQSDEPPHPKQWNKSLPDDLATICLKCLEKHPARRYASAEVLGQDLERWLAYQPIEARPSGFWERKIKWARRKPSIAALSVLVVLLSVFGLGGLFLQTLQKQAALEKAHQAAMDLATARAPVLTARKVMRHEDRAASLVFSMDGSNILTSSKDTKARVWNAFSGELLLVLEGSNGSLSHAEFSPDESMILTLSIDEGFYYPHLSPMGEPIATWEGPWNGENKVRLWDAKTGEIRHVLEGHSAQVTDARFSPDGQWVVTSSLDKTAVIWESSTGRKMHVLTGHEASVASVEFTPDGQSIATTSMGQVLEVKVEESAAGHRSTSSTNNRAYESELVKFWDLESGKQIGGFRNQVSQVLGGKEVFGNSRCQVQFSNNGRWAVTVADLPDQVGVWDLKKREWIAALEGHHHTVLDAEFSPDGQSVATACADHVARVFSVPDGHLMHLFKSHTAPVLRVDFSSDEKRLLTVSADGTGRLWDLKTGHGLAVLQGHDDRVVDGKFHPNGFHIATASRDHTVRIWESGSLEKMAISFKGHTKRVTQLDWHPDSNHVASGSDDLTARVWSLAQPDRHHMLKGYEKAPNDVVRNRLLGEVRCVAFSPDGNGLWTASNDVDGAFLNILGLPPTKMSFQPARLWD